MRPYLPFILACFSSVLLAQDSLNMESLSQYDPPNMPTVAGSNAYEYNDTWAWVDAFEKEYAILGSADSIHFFDITECSDPTYLFGYKGGASSIWRDFKTYNGYAYAVADSGSEGLHIFDISDAHNGNISHVLTTTAFFTRSHNIFIDEGSGRLYVFGTLPNGDDLRILDLNIDPANPTMIYNNTMNSIVGGTDNLYIHDGQVINDTLYASHFYKAELYIYDFTDVNNPQFIEAAPTGSATHSSWNDPANDYAYVCRESTNLPVMIVDLKDLDDPINDIFVAGSFQHPNDPGESILAHNPFVRGDYLYISYYEDGTKVYDITNRTSPTVLAYYETNDGSNGGNWGTYPFLPSGCIVSSDMHNGLFTLQVDYGLTDTCTPMVEVDDPSIATGTYVASNHLWSSQLVDSGEDVLFQANFSVTLEAGFEAKADADFEAKIDKCISPN